MAMLSFLIKGEIIQCDKFLVDDNKDSIMECFIHSERLIVFAKKRGVIVNNLEDLYHKRYQGIWDECSTHLAFVIYDYIVKLKPETVIICGNISKARKFIEKGINAELKKLYGKNYPKIDFE